MDKLRQLFESLGLADVQTVIASGNVVFQSAARNTRTLETRIERQLGDALGYEVATFVRSLPELTAVASHSPFRDASRADSSLFVAFLAESPKPKTAKTLLSLTSPFDMFHVHHC